MCCSHSFFFVIFGAFFSDFLGVISSAFSWGFGGVYMLEPFVVPFPLISRPNP
jgi:hypothetical protein